MFFKRVFLINFFLILVVYSLFLVVFSPGLLGPDSLAIIWHIEKEGYFNSGKTSFWFYFVKFFYENYKLSEIPIFVQIIFVSFVFSRIISWCWFSGFKWYSLFLLFFFALTPHLILNLLMLYPDVIFSVAISGILFEIWICFKAKKINLFSVFCIFIFFPVAIFFRSNGVVYIFPLIFLIFFLERKYKYIASFILLFWVFVYFVFDEGKQQEAIFPLALYETVNFMQPRPMVIERSKYDGPRITETSKKILDFYYPDGDLYKYFDRDYWNPLVHDENGPRLMRISDVDKRVIVREFFCYNVWQNIPAFFSSRVNIFLVSFLAEGALIDFDFSKIVLKNIDSNSVYRKFNFIGVERVLKDLYYFSERFRVVFWSPYLGVGLIFFMVIYGGMRKNIGLLLVSFPMLIQFVSVFVFSVAGEYRYVLPFFLFPVAAIPIVLSEFKK